MPTFTWLLFDADNTLLDFSKASKKALWQTYTDFGQACSEAIHDAYKLCNARAWTAFEQEQITAAQLRIQRFADLFQVLEAEPASPALFSQRFLENLVLLSEAYEGVALLLNTLQQNYRLGIITNGLKEVQRPRLAHLQLDHYFDTIVVSDEIGSAKPQEAFFQYAFDTLGGAAREEVLVIGDSLHSDILGGQQFGMPTCWISHGRVNDTEIVPDFTIPQVHGLREVLESAI
ncbi:MAG TPA: pyrimidine 5'-nucleotidase [Saprospiraceae bacterium]|nr:pyrimidine 5'-nucleotidase [Saprospiraceae bacterium]HMQ81767.1 pyrimidine 5'-nucleotidase [Saprospiraceae bacterium]